MSIVGVRRHRSLCEEPGNTQTEVRWEEEGGGKKKKKKKVEMWRENETEKKKTPLVFVFLFPALSFPSTLGFSAGFKTSVSTQTTVVRRRECRGPGMWKARPRNQWSRSARHVCLVYLPWPRVPREVKGPAAVKGAIVLQEKSGTNIYQWGEDAKTGLAASQTSCKKRPECIFE